MSKVNVWLYDNLLTADPNDYFGKVKPLGTLNNEAIADEMMKEGTEYQKETLVDILNRSDRIKVAKLAEGYSINTGVYHGRIGVSGAFHGATDRFDPAEHRIIASFTSSADLRQELKKTQVEIVDELDNIEDMRHLAREKWKRRARHFEGKNAHPEEEPND